MHAVCILLIFFNYGFYAFFQSSIFLYEITLRLTLVAQKPLEKSSFFSLYMIFSLLEFTDCKTVFCPKFTWFLLILDIIDIDNSMALPNLV